MWYPVKLRSARAGLSIIFAVVAIGAAMVAGFFVVLDRQDALQREVAGLRTSLFTTTAMLSETKGTLDMILENNRELRDQLAAAREDQKTVEAALSQTTKQVGGLEAELEGKVGEQTLGARILEWEPRVARLKCTFRQDGEESTAHASAVSVYRSGRVQFMTNRHVLEHKNMTLDSCTVKVSGVSDDIRIESNAVEFSDDRDIAFLSVSAPSAGLVQGATQVRACAQEPASGSRVLILGYPATGSGVGITSTEGIISGIEKDYYITSAKIERGNSGGAAVHVEDNCFLGLPTLVVVGRLESLARILPVTSLE